MSNSFIALLGLGLEVEITIRAVGATIRAVNNFLGGKSDIICLKIKGNFHTSKFEPA